MAKLKNFGVMSNKQLKALLKRFDQLEAIVHRGEIVCSVEEPVQNRKILSAARITETAWHVMAIPGLISHGDKT